MAELVAAAIPGFDFAALREEEGGLARGRALAAAAGVDGADDAASLGELLALCFESECEHRLVQPTFVLEHPTEVSPLARPHRSAHLVTRARARLLHGCLGLAPPSHLHHLTTSPPSPPRAGAWGY